MTVLTRAVVAALRERNYLNVISAPAISHRFSTSAARAPPSPADKFEAADQALLDDSVNAPAVAVEIPNLLRPRVVVYDGVCHLCHAGVKWLIEADKDKKIKFCCLQSEAAQPYMSVCGLEREDVLRRFLFVEGPGLYHQGSSAALRVLSYLPLPYSALSSLMIIPTPLRDAVYDYVAKNRYDWFGKDDDCLVLKETELLERFVDWEELLHRSRSKQL
ncbi:hypothetical protein ACJIZ3_025575 [Penstemon smallii]|uniref:Thiol-disulfide oxidoreductase DCC n=1 Tax=Penstemon smallii TaxID=265156 RepID=A0ABD3TUY0_9LAMI